VARIDLAALDTLATGALERAGASAGMARATSRCLVAADAEGLASHGVSRVPQYASQLRLGRADGKAIASVVNARGGACLVDAACGLAYEACAVAVREAIRRARDSGVAFAGVTNSNHFGVAAIHLAPIAEAGFVGLAFGNSPAAMPAWGGKTPLFGTNPVAAVLPRRSAPALTIDLSLSEVARGRIMVAAQQGKPIPAGWALDRDGKPTTDPQSALEGSMLPAGGVKGAMLALIVESLACALTGAAFGFEADSFFVEQGNRPRIGQAFLAIDPGALAGRERYLERIETLVAAMLADSGVRLPGARRLELRRRAEREGVEIPDALLAKLKELAT
jgi:(2R)-3-sulfolactate dehydrogenase (NADP+)